MIPSNNEMKRTSHGPNGGSLLISVLGRPMAVTEGAAMSYTIDIVSGPVPERDREAWSVIEAWREELLGLGTAIQS